LVKEVPIFIGFANFYRRFIKDFSKICTPITKTLKGDKTRFHWGPKQDEAFTEVKRRFVTASILEHVYPDRKRVVETDASDFALGCVLSQFKDKRLHPVAFHSRKLNPAERNISKKSTLPQIRRCCALMQATSLLRSLRSVRPEFRCNALYLLTRRCVVLTPCLHLSSGSLHFLLMMAPASHCLFRAP